MSKKICVNIGYFDRMYPWIIGSLLYSYVYESKIKKKKAKV